MRPVYLCSRCGAVHIGLVVELLKFLQCSAGFLCQTHDNCLAMVVPDRQPGWRALFWGLKQVVNTVAVNLKILEGDLDLCRACRVLFNLLAPAIYGAQQTRNDATISQRFPAAHRVCLASSCAAMGEDGQVEAVEEMLYRGRD